MAVRRNSQDNNELSIVPQQQTETSSLSLQRQTEMIKERLNLKVDKLFNTLELRQAKQQSAALDQEIELLTQEIELQVIAEENEAVQREINQTQDEISVKKRVVKRLHDRL